jgi:hypothetical protein
MYVLKIPRTKTNIIDILDKIMDGSTIHLPDAKTSRMLGIYVKPWHRNGFIGIYQDKLLNDTVVKLNVNIKNVEKKLGVGKRVEYTVDDSFLKTCVWIPKI